MGDRGKAAKSDVEIQTDPPPLYGVSSVCTIEYKPLTQAFQTFYIWPHSIQVHLPLLLALWYSILQSIFLSLIPENTFKYSAALSSSVKILSPSSVNMPLTHHCSLGMLPLVFPANLIESFSPFN